MFDIACEDGFRKMVHYQCELIKHNIPDDIKSVVVQLATALYAYADMYGVTLSVWFKEYDKTVRFRFDDLVLDKHLETYLDEGQLKRYRDVRSYRQAVFRHISAAVDRQFV